MKKVLLLTSSIFGDNGNSSQLAGYFKAAAAGKDLSITEKDLIALDLPHLAAPELLSWMAAPGERTAEQAELAKLSDNLIEELKAHDVIVLAVPLYNLGIPSQVKAYFDRLERAGVTFKYTENGPQGLIEGKQAVVLAARGGVYAGSEWDSQTPHLSTLFTLMGITEQSFVYAEGLNMGDEPKAKALAEAKTKIEEVVAAL
ncbi:FMN-dependent NADH-azoreductase [Gallaecimonas pentaromativorans]|uniref:FMN dependent NADH:quinone oxidoreductase n=1 Tax=Gallaecimonas pentaromativorans TaxID=584787 RepID=A0A3N1PH40_9GAMM|nr:NAD(P)H-dependent oxidoreductase [Gallaecimonas pentaromativorans]MED5525580.1 NAD(P)H-dependent oxidoreductase [Pseudomonadota bacterium]ROQ27389.1 FMN-dependent NADH-azoreductase [Gallaecimonas pentaromativorans]